MCVRRQGDAFHVVDLYSDLGRPHDASVGVFVIGSADAPRAMRLIGDSSANEMVLAFLRAERSSERFKNLVGPFDSALLDSPDLSNSGENDQRAGILQRYRGYRVGAYLFQGFPSDVKWRRWAVASDDLRRFRYAKHDTWMQLSRGSRLVGDGATNVDVVPAVEEGVSISSQVKAVAAAIDRDESVEEMVCVSATDDAAPEDIVVLEGHVRATAYLYARRMPGEITAIIGSSPRMTDWVFF